MEKIGEGKEEGCWVSNPVSTIHGMESGRPLEEGGIH